jgi:hypothetical protein
VRERKSKSLKEASEMTDNYVAARMSNRDKRHCTKCGKTGHIARFPRSSDAKEVPKPVDVKEVTEEKTVSGKGKNIIPVPMLSRLPSIDRYILPNQ